MGSNGVRAFDIPRCVADDKDLRAVKFAAEQLVATLMGNRRDLVPIFVVVRECTCPKARPQMIMSQFDLRAETNVPGQQSQHRRFRQRLEIAEHGMHARKHGAAQLPEKMIELENVVIQESAEVLWRRLDLIMGEKLADDRCVRATGKIQSGGAVGNAELRGAYVGKSLLSSAAAEDEGPVDVEQYKSDHKREPRKLSICEIDGNADVEESGHLLAGMPGAGLRMSATMGFHR